MQLPSDGREYVTWTVTTAPLGIDLEVIFDNEEPWWPLVTVGEGAYRLLVAGPDAEDGPPETVVLAVGRHRAYIRAADYPEIVIRSSGSISVRQSGRASEDS